MRPELQEQSLILKQPILLPVIQSPKLQKLPLPVSLTVNSNTQRSCKTKGKEVRWVLSKLLPIQPTSQVRFTADNTRNHKLKVQGHGKGAVKMTSNACKSSKKIGIMQLTENDPSSRTRGQVLVIHICRPWLYPILLMFSQVKPSKEFYMCE